MISKPYNSILIENINTLQRNYQTTATSGRSQMSAGWEGALQGRVQCCPSKEFRSQNLRRIKQRKQFFKSKNQFRILC